MSPFLNSYCICRNNYLRYNKGKHCGFVSILLQLRLFRGDSNHSGLSKMVISWLTLDVFMCVITQTSLLCRQQCKNKGG